MASIKIDAINTTYVRSLRRERGVLPHHSLGGTWCESYVGRICSFESPSTAEFSRIGPLDLKNDF